MKRSELLKIVKKLQDTTGLSMAECLKALKKANYNLGTVMQILKNQGFMKASKKFNKSIISSEGRIISVQIIHEKKTKCGLLKIGCETDYVSAGNDFANLCDTTKKHVENNNLATITEALKLDYQKEPFKNYLLMSSARFHEKISLVDYQLCSVSKMQFASTYIHNFQIGVIVVTKSLTNEFSTAQKAVVKKMALQICSTCPLYITEADVPLAHTKKMVELIITKIRKELPGKAEDLYEKISRGRLKKTLKDEVLVLQKAVFEPDKTVGELLSENQLEITKFIRLSIKDS